jgi:hypothetical protein
LGRVLTHHLTSAMERPGPPAERKLGVGWDIDSNWICGVPGGPGRSSEPWPPAEKAEIGSAEGSDSKFVSAMECLVGLGVLESGGHPQKEQGEGLGRVLNRVLT